MPADPAVETRLLYAKAQDGGLFPLADPEAVLAQLTHFVTEARKAVAAGNALPGIGAADKYNDLGFALPGGAKESYIEAKEGPVTGRLGELPNLWEMS